MAADGKQQAQAARGEPYWSLPQSGTTTGKKMAALIRHGILASTLKSIGRFHAPSTTTGRRRVSTRLRGQTQQPETSQTLESTQRSLSVRGFLRAIKPYIPPSDVSSKFDEICEKEGIPKADDTVISDPEQRFRLFVACEREFKYLLPNSVLCHIETVGDLRAFYSTPIEVATPLDAMRNLNLPKNLHIQYNYHRFHPDTDTMFGGKTAFPSSSTLVTGLKYKKKYPGHQQKDPYLDLLLRSE